MKWFVSSVLCLLLFSCETINEGSTIGKDLGRFSVSSGLHYRLQEKKSYLPIKSDVVFGVHDNFNLGVSASLVPDEVFSISPYGMYNFSSSGSGLVLGLEAKYVNLFKERSIGLPLSSSKSYKELFYLVPSVAIGADSGALHSYLGVSWNLSPELYAGMNFRVGILFIGVRASTLGGLAGTIGANYIMSMK